ncbi:MAG TPA: WXG100 family type VII secretion target [Actinoplanes sp.]|nr:WXG100 family type VII secretion target [Actinoplanes sp.]
MSQTTADAAAMEEAARKFEDVNDQLQGMLKTLMSRLEATQTAWVGQGGQSFTAVKQQWAADQQSMSNALRETAEAIRGSGKGYEATDSEAASRMSAINPGIQLPL